MRTVSLSGTEICLGRQSRGEHTDLTHQHCSELVSHTLLTLFAKSWASFQNEAMAHRCGTGAEGVGSSGGCNLEPAGPVDILLQGGRALGEWGLGPSGTPSGPSQVWQVLSGGQEPALLNSPCDSDFILRKTLRGNLTI